MRGIIKKTSKVDQSVNWIIPSNGSYLECRYVRRSPNYISSYLSSHNGCTMGCKFCWLTATKQNKFNHSNIEQYMMQLNKVLSHAKEIDGTKSKNIRFNINFMARGEPLANKCIINQYRDLHRSMEDKVIKEYRYNQMKVNISTIMPKIIKDRSLVDIFGYLPVNIYYSIYSIKEPFRFKWLPHAMPWDLALRKLYLYQMETDNPITFHFAIIQGENDNLNDVKEMAEKINSFNFKKTKFNLVRFNPHPDTNDKEPNEEHLEKIYEIMKSVCKDDKITTNKSRIISRVGSDVWVSCGMFPNDSDL